MRYSPRTGARIENGARESKARKKIAAAGTGTCLGEMSEIGIEETEENILCQPPYGVTIQIARQRSSKRTRTKRVKNEE